MTSLALKIYTEDRIWGGISMQSNLFIAIRPTGCRRYSDWENSWSEPWQSGGLMLLIVFLLLSGAWPTCTCKTWGLNGNKFVDLWKVKIWIIVKIPLTVNTVILHVIRISASPHWSFNCRPENPKSVSGWLDAAHRAARGQETFPFPVFNKRIDFLRLTWTCCTYWSWDRKEPPDIQSCSPLGT